MSEFQKEKEIEDEQKRFEFKSTLSIHSDLNDE